METGAIVAIIATTGGFLLIPVLITVGILITLHMDKKEYNQAIPGYKTRMKRSPYTGEKIAKVMDALIQQWAVVKNHDKKEIKKKLGNIRVEWLRGTKEEDDTIKRYIVDKLGRKIAGDHEGNKIRVVYLDTDHITDTAFIHECCHELEELIGIPNGSHSDPTIWGREGIVKMTVSTAK